MTAITKSTNFDISRPAAHARFRIAQFMCERLPIGQLADDSGPAADSLISCNYLISRVKIYPTRRGTSLEMTFGEVAVPGGGRNLHSNAAVWGERLARLRLRPFCLSLE